ncbi:hypothetical protein L218DRAFT_619021 [Marasmius fiardii PR-910]|nr:hypothetical protein L218DRAFT_619021 [Marasmius fiardii PR-910]
MGIELPAATFQEIAETLDHQRMVSYLDVVSAMLFVYEIIINFPAEFEHIWRRKWTFLTGLYALQRYLPLLDSLVIVLRKDHGASLSTSECTLYYQIAGWSFVFGISLSEITLTLRVWAVWERSISVVIGLIVFFLACWVPSCIFLARFLSSMEFATPPTLSRGCFVSGGSNIMSVFWVMNMVYEAGILIMILIPGVRACRSGGRTELLDAVYQDGVIYYALLFVISTINVVVSFTHPYFVLLLASYVRKSVQIPHNPKVNFCI